MTNRSDIPFVASLGDALESAIVPHYRTEERSPRRVPRLVALGVVALSLVVVGVLFAVVVRPQSAAAVTIERIGDSLIIRLVDLESDPDQVRDDIQETGLDVEVIAIPASPSLQGRFVASYGPQQTPDLELLETDGDTYRAFKIPAEFEGRLELYLGRAATNGEAFLASGSAFDVGEPLECSGLSGATVADVLPVLESLGLVSRWQTPLDVGGTLSMVEIDPTEILGLFATDAIMMAPNEVLFFASETPDSIFAGPLNGGGQNCP